MKTILTVLAFIALSVMLFALCANNIEVAVIAFVAAVAMAVFTTKRHLILLAVYAIFTIGSGLSGLWLFNHFGNGTYPIQSYSLTSEQRQRGSLLFGTSSRKHEILRCNVIEPNGIRIKEFDVGMRKHFYVVKTTDNRQTLVVSPDAFTLYVNAP